MPTVRGEFGTRESAQRAVDALKAAGVPADGLRIWNIIADSQPPSQRGGATAAGAVTGALLGGVGGLLVGAGVGGVIDSAGADGSRSPPSSGVRVVVDVIPDGPDAAAILREHGAVNVK